MPGYRIPEFSSIDELLREFAIHMLDTMYEGKDIGPRLRAKNLMFRQRLLEMGYGEVRRTAEGFVAASLDGLREAAVRFEDAY